MTESTIVLITGANSGVGYATAKTVAARPGYHVILACRDVAKGQQTLAELEAAGVQGTLSVLQLDVEDDASIFAAVNSVSKQFGRVDAFISNAGTTSPGSAGRERLTKTFSTNVFGAMLVSEAFIPLLLKSQHPCMVQISSALGSVGLASDPKSMHSTEAWHEYRMSKAALNMMTIQIHKRLKDQNVRVFAFCPGLVRSKLRGHTEEAMSARGNAGDPMVSGKAILDIIAGRRDGDLGKFVHKDGIYSW